MFKFKEKVPPVNSEVLAQLKNIESHELLCVWNGHVFCLYRLNSQRFPALGFYLKFRVLQDYCLVSVWFRLLGLTVLAIL